MSAPKIIANTTPSSFCSGGTSTPPIIAKSPPIASMPFLPPTNFGAASSSNNNNHNHINSSFAVTDTATNTTTSYSEGTGGEALRAPTPPMTPPLMGGGGSVCGSSTAMMMPCTPPLGPSDTMPLSAYDPQLYGNNVDTNIVGSYRGIEPFATYRAPNAVPASCVPPRGMIPAGIYSKFAFKGKATMTHPSQPYGASPTAVERAHQWSNIPDCHNNRPIAMTSSTQCDAQKVFRSRDDICCYSSSAMRSRDDMTTTSTPPQRTPPNARNSKDEMPQ